METKDTIYKLLRSAELATFVTKGFFEGSADDLRDGFVHLSTDAQLNGTLEKHFSGEFNIFALDCRPLMNSAELVWETSRGGALFPHLYRAMQLSDVAAIYPLPQSKWPPSHKG